MGPHVTGTPIKAERSAAAIAVPSELFKKLAVMVEVLPAFEGAVLQIVVGEAVTFNCNHGLASNDPPPDTSPPA